jgi:Uma2 family endonuclease
MTTITTKTLTLEEFLGLPETQPASEFIGGEILQKPMPQGEHSRLQSKLTSTINEIAEPTQIAYAFPELRCVFGGEAIVPDIAVFRWNRIPRTESGRIANRFELNPDWAIEILSPGQSLTKTLEKLLFCSQEGGELGWLIAPADEAIALVTPMRQVSIVRGDRSVTVLEGIELSLTANDVFDWLKI